MGEGTISAPVRGQPRHRAVDAGILAETHEVVSALPRVQGYGRRGEDRREAIVALIEELSALDLGVAHVRVEEEIDEVLDPFRGAPVVVRTGDGLERDTRSEGED